MHLISTLCAGVMGAANGHAEVYIRDTATRATTYGDFEGTTSNSSGANITLDAYGSVELYVNQLVDVVVKDADGTLVRSFTDGYASPNIEVISPAFTGTDYVSAASTVSEPTTLQAVLDLWETNNGAPDWKVNVGGAATTVENAFGTTTGLVYNVKSPVYGATGDGVTNDQTAIAAALAAAVAAGGGIVFFPKGTYLIGAAIEWDHRVSVMGVGMGLSVLTTNSAANGRLLTWTSGSPQGAPLVISGMAFASTQSNTGEQIYSTVAVNMVLERCWLGASTTSTGTVLSIGGASKLRLINSRFTANGSANIAATWTSTSAVVVATGCVFDTVGTTWAGSLVKPSGNSVFTDCVFDYTSLTAAGTRTIIENLSASDELTVTGCVFKSLAQTVDFLFTLLDDALVIVRDNDFGTQANSTHYTVTGTLRAGSFLQLVPKGSATAVLATSATFPVASEFVYIDFASTAPSVSHVPVLYPNQRLEAIIKNSSGGNWGVSFIGGDSIPSTTGTVNAGARRWYYFLATDFVTPGTYLWTLCAAHN
jgi:hypothetical protein